MGSSELSLLVAGTSTLWHMEAKLRKAVCILLKCESSIAQGALQWKSSTLSQPLQPTISIPTGLDGSLTRDRYHKGSLTVTFPASLPQHGRRPVHVVTVVELHSVTCAISPRCICAAL